MLTTWKSTISAGVGRDLHEKIPPVDKVLIQPNTVRVKFHCTFSFCNNEHKLYLLLHCCKIVIQLSTFIQSNTYIRDWNLPSGLKRASGSQSAIVGPVRTYLFLYENGDLFYPFWPLERAKKVTEHASFEKRSREWRFLKTQFYLNREDGWNMRRFLKTITSRAQIPVNAHSPIKMVPFPVTIVLLCERAKTIKKGSVWTQTVFENVMQEI